MTGAQARGQVVRRLEASELSPEAAEAARELVRAVVLAVKFHCCDIATLPVHERDSALVVAVEMARLVLAAMIDEQVVTS